MSIEPPILLEEKWQRLTNPKTLEDYGIVMSRSEIESFNEGRVELFKYGLHSDQSEKAGRAIKEFGKRMAEFRMKVAAKILEMVAEQFESGNE